MVDEALAIVIRKVHETDLTALEWEGEYKHFRRLYQQAYRESLVGKRILLLAEVEDQVIGQLFIHLHSRWYAHFKPDNAAYLHSFRVRPGYREQGVGARLLNTAEERLLEISYNRSVISVAKENPRALRMYEGNGYHIFSQDPGVWSYYDDKGVIRTVMEPAFVLTKILA